MFSPDGALISAPAVPHCGAATVEEVACPDRILCRNQHDEFRASRKHYFRGGWRLGVEGGGGQNLEI